VDDVVPALAKQARQRHAGPNVAHRVWFPAKGFERRDRQVADLRQQRAFGTGLGTDDEVHIVTALPQSPAGGKRVFLRAAGPGVSDLGDAPLGVVLAAFLIVARPVAPGRALPLDQRQ
jgi:hypothetical protein